MKVAVLAALLAFPCLACTTRLGEFSIVSRRAATDAPAAAPIGGKDLASGASCRRTILFLIPLGPKADLSDAFDAALASAPGANALTDVTVRRKTVITVVYNEHCFVVEGRPVTLQRPLAGASP